MAHEAALAGARTAVEAARADSALAASHVGAAHAQEEAALEAALAAAEAAVEAEAGAAAAAAAASEALAADRSAERLQVPFAAE